MDSQAPGRAGDHYSEGGDSDGRDVVVCPITYDDLPSIAASDVASIDRTSCSPITRQRNLSSFAADQQVASLENAMAAH